MALRKLYENKEASLSGKLKKIYTNSAFGVERMEAMRLLFLLNAPELTDVLKMAVDDSYEFVRRFAVEYITERGTDELIPALVRSIMNDRTSRRVLYKAMDGSKLMDQQKLSKEVEKQAAASSHWINKDDYVNSLLDKVAKQKQSGEQEIKSLMDNTTSKKEKLFIVRSYRNNPIHSIIPELCSFAGDSSRDAELRIATIEALSWYTHSCFNSDYFALSGRR